MNTTTSSSSTLSNLRASAPPWIWAVVGAVFTLIVGLAAGMAMRGPQHAEAQAADVGTLAPTSAGIAAKGTNAAGDDTRVAVNDNASATGKQRSKSGSSSSHEREAAQAAGVCTTCGVVESVTAVKHKGKGTGLGAVAGGVAGGLLGNQMGKGSGNTAMTILGAAGGAYAGHQVEKNVRATTSYQTVVRMDDGSKRTFQEPAQIAVGSHVVVEGSHLKLSPAASAAAQ